MRRRVGRIFLKLLQLVALALSSIATAAVILEGGFWVRHALHAHIDNGSESGSRRIFLVGDSVLGNIREPDSIAGHFASAIRSRQNAPSSIVDLSEPAQTLYAANQKIADDFKIDESTVIIVMLGKSDWERPSAVTQRVSWLDRLQILKIWGLVKADTSRAIQYWQQKFSPSDPESSPDFAVAWMLYGKGNCHDAIPMFEKGLLQRANYLRAIQSLYHCYYLEKRFKEGKLFLEQLSPLSTKLSQLIKLYALNLQNEFETQTSSISTQSQAATSQLLISMPVSRETFRIQMRLLQNMGHSEAFFNRLRQIRSDESFRLTESGTNSLIQIVSNALGQKAQVIILQYPTDHAQSIKKVLLQFDNKISVIDTRLWLLENTTSTQLINLIDNDIDHVTKDAARILGEKLADFVLSSGE